MEEVRIGIIGIGNMGSAHALSIDQGKVQGLRLTAVCDEAKDRLMWAEENLSKQVEVFTDYHDLLKSKLVDAVLIATPHAIHPLISIEAFENELHVLTEKPAGIDTLRVKQMNEAAVKSGKVFGIMYNQRTNPLFAYLKKLMDAGELGDMKRFVWMISNWYRTQTYYNSGQWRGTWKGEGGGVLLNQCPHNLDIWQWITGMPTKVRAFCKYGHYHDINVEDDVTILAEYENNASALFIASTGEYPGTNRLELSGTKGKVVIENGALKHYRLEKDERELCFESKTGFINDKIDCTEIIQEGPESGHLGILQNFTDAILKGEKLLAPGIEGVHGLSISNAAYLSDWTDQWIELPIEDEKFYLMLKEKQENEAQHNIKVSKEDLKGAYSKRWMVLW